MILRGDSYDAVKNTVSELLNKDIDEYPRILKLNKIHCTFKKFTVFDVTEDRPFAVEQHLLVDAEDYHQAHCIVESKGPNIFLENPLTEIALGSFLGHSVFRGDVWDSFAQHKDKVLLCWKDYISKCLASSCVDYMTVELPTTTLPLRITELKIRGIPKHIFNNPGRIQEVLVFLSSFGIDSQRLELFKSLWANLRQVLYDPVSPGGLRRLYFYRLIKPYFDSSENLSDMLVKMAINEPTWRFEDIRLIWESELERPRWEDEYMFQAC